MLLTKKDIKAMKEADDVVLRRTINGANITERIELRKKVKNSVWNEEVSYNIELTARKQFSEFTAFVIMYDMAIWETIVSNLKEGDELRLEWYADAKTNDLLKAANLHGDAVYMNVYRKNKGYKYLLTTSVTYDNSARMIKKVS